MGMKPQRISTSLLDLPVLAVSRLNALERSDMPAKNEDLHGMVPDTADVALLLLDVINDLEFEGGEQLLKYVLPMARNLADFKQRPLAAGIPAIYVNDNYGRWQSDFNRLIEHCMEDDVRG